MRIKPLLDALCVRRGEKAHESNEHIKYSGQFKNPFIANKTLCLSLDELHRAILLSQLVCGLFNHSIK